MKEHARTEILVSVHNGEKYLRNQLDSLLALNGFEDIQVTVRDDGSTDGSVEILMEYEKNHGFKLIIGKCIGINASMLWLVNNSRSDCDFFAFCDQDDVWHPDKIELAVSTLEKESKDTPALWGCREELVDENLNFTELMPLPKYCGNFYNAVVQNTLPGHVQVFNRALRDMLKNVMPEKMLMYDWFNYMIASAFGKVLYEPKPLGKYRQHGSNAIGFSVKTSVPNYYKRIKSGIYRIISDQMESFYSLFSRKLPNEYRNELENYLKNRTNPLARLKYISSTKILRDTQREAFNFRLMYFLGFY